MKDQEDTESMVQRAAKWRIPSESPSLQALHSQHAHIQHFVAEFAPLRDPHYLKTQLESLQEEQAQKEVMDLESTHEVTFSPEMSLKQRTEALLDVQLFQKVKFSSEYNYLAKISKCWLAWVNKIQSLESLAKLSGSTAGELFRLAKVINLPQEVTAFQVLRRSLENSQLFSQAFKDL